MTLYTLVNDGYDVEVYKNRSRLARRLAENGYAMEEGADKCATYAQIMKALAGDSILRFYELDRADWTYRVEIHTGAQ